MAGAAQTIILIVLELALSIWLGGMVTIMIVARVTSSALKPADRVAVFRGIGQIYGKVGTTSLLVALACGAALLSDRGWNGVATAAAVLAALIIAALLLGMIQARRMTVLRHHGLAHPDDPQLRSRVARGTTRATALRGCLGVLTVVLVVLGAVLATTN